ncbi:MAG: hypothetical protein IJU31_01025 [Synergistaceae bacterium]|nr:hypothetical protein [Synergistaceae bacterium]
MPELTWVQEHYINEAIAKGHAKGHAEGRAEGEKFAAVKFAKRLRNIGMNDGQIHQFTDLSFDEIALI